MITQRQACVEILFQHVSRILPVTRLAYTNMLDGWTLEPIEHDGEVIGAIMLLNHEIHIAVTPGVTKHWAKRWMMREFIDKRIQQFGYLTTAASKKNPVAIRIIERLGFYRVSEDEQYIQYRIDHANFK